MLPYNLYYLESVARLVQLISSSSLFLSLSLALSLSLYLQRNYTILIDIRNAFRISTLVFRICIKEKGGGGEKEFPINIQEIGGRERILSYNYTSKKIKLPYILYAPENSLLS